MNFFCEPDGKSYASCDRCLLSFVSFVSEAILDVSLSRDLTGSFLVSDRKKDLVVAYILVLAMLAADYRPLSVAQWAMLLTMSPVK